MDVRVLTSSLVLAVLLTSPASAGTIPDRGDSIVFEDVGDRRAVIVIPAAPVTPAPPPSSGTLGGSSLGPWEGSTARPPSYPPEVPADLERYQTAEDPFPPVRPLLDEETLFAIERKRLNQSRTTVSPMARPVTEPTPLAGTATQHVAADAHRHVSYAQVESYKGILNASQAQEAPTTSLAVQPSVGTATEQKQSTAPSNNFNDFGPALAEALLDLLKERPMEPQSPPVVPKPVPTLPPRLPANTPINTDELEELFPELTDVLESVLDSKPQPPCATPVFQRPRPMPPVLPATTEVFPDDLFPALQKELESILKNDKENRTTTATWVTQRPIHTTTMKNKDFSDLFTPLEDTIKDILDEGYHQQDVSTQQPPRPSGTQRPAPGQYPAASPPNVHDFSEFIPALEEVLSEILRNNGSGHYAGYPTRPEQSVTKKPSTYPPVCQPNIPNSVAVPNDTDSEALFQALKASLLEILKSRELETSQALQTTSEAPQRNVNKADKYYPKLKKVLEQILEEEAAVSNAPRQQLQISNTVDKGSYLQVVYQILKTMFEAKNGSNTVSPASHQ